MFSMILISHLNFTTKRERIPYILAFFESCLLEYLKNQVDVDKSTETQVVIIFDIGPFCVIILNYGKKIGAYPQKYRSYF